MPETMLTPWVATLLLLLDWLIRIGLVLRVIMRRRPVGVSLSWLGVILFFPFFGAVIYLFLGEARIGRYRLSKLSEIRPRIERYLTRLHGSTRIDLADTAPVQHGLIQHGQRVYGFPAIGGNRLELLDDSDAVFDHLIGDIDAAQRSVHLLFYIWYEGGRVDRVTNALERAAQRGVVCRVACDSVGSKTFLKSESAKRLRAAGIEVVEMLTAGLWRTLLRRQDLRNHRKIVVIDGEIGYTGSMNMADPSVFKQDAGVGAWVDAAVRVTGPVVETLGVVFLSDWDVETEQPFGDFEDQGDLHLVPAKGSSIAQVMPSGPGFSEEAIRQTLMTAIYGAQQELLLVTPYFVPDESLLTAITGAASRGVRVVLIVPKKNDSAMVRLASRSLYIDLLSAGVELYEYRGGLLHTKAVVVDGHAALFGTVNLDMRSLWLNFEVTLAVYDPEFVERLRGLLTRYIDQSVRIDLAGWRARPFHHRLMENTVRLLGPLL
ncbi:MAG: cardiolipin synthase [Planctomycetota bacterium]